MSDQRTLERQDIKNWIKTEVYEGLSLIMVLFKNGIEEYVETTVDKVYVDYENSIFTRVYAGGKIFNSEGICHEAGNDYCRIQRVTDSVRSY